MRVYWRQVKRGQSLILGDDNDGQEENLGGFRDTKRGIDALAKTFSYDPDRSRKGFPTIEEAKAFVESFRPWELYGAQDVTVDPQVRPALDSAGTDSGDSGPSTVQPHEPVSPEQLSSEPLATPEPLSPKPLSPEPLATPEPLSTKEWWQFWKKG